MTKIRNTGAGGPPPTGGPDPSESINKTSEAKESTQASAASQQSESTPQKQVADKYAAGDLKAAGNQMKSHLDSQLDTRTAETKKETETSMTPEELAKKAALGQVHFAPPYVPVGPVVMGDNISVPGQTGASGETREMNLRSDQFQINEQGNLVITNEKLIEYFKSLKESGKDILLGITNRKPPGEE